MPCKIIQAGVASQKPRQHMTDGNDMSDYPGRNHGSDVKEGMTCQNTEAGMTSQNTKAEIMCQTTRAGMTWQNTKVGIEC